MFPPPPPLPPLWFQTISGLNDSGRLQGGDSDTFTTSEYIVVQNESYNYVNYMYGSSAYL